MLPLGSVAAILVCGSLADFAPAHDLSVQPRNSISPLFLLASLSSLMFLLIALASSLATPDHKQGVMQSGQEKTPGRDTQCQGLLQLRAG